MVRRVALLAAMWFLAPQAGWAGGFVHSANFSVLTPDLGTAEQTEAFARSVLAAAERYRRDIAVTWLGDELPSGVGRATINVAFSAERSQGLTWARDSERRQFHTLYLSTAPDQAAGPVLAHEVAHVVLATEFPHPRRLAAWVEEGIASSLDDDGRQASRAKLLSWFVRTGNWPRLATMFEMENIAPSDASSYTAAHSVVAYLVARSDRAAFLRFCRDAQHDSWDRALRQHYRLSVDDLQVQWQRWVERHHGDSRTAFAAPTAPR